MSLMSASKMTSCKPKCIFVFCFPGLFPMVSPILPQQRKSPPKQRSGIFDAVRSHRLNARLGPLEFASHQKHLTLFESGTFDLWVAGSIKASQFSPKASKRPRFENCNLSTCWLNLFRTTHTSIHFIRIFERLAFKSFSRLLFRFTPPAVP